ncbi:beta-ketoacyl synthase N-terminal-like domain-containing protein [Campylobacter concisus]|uniref:beta-ketoacyl synthase N-terminal-like domain-containing protein n=1 Tax=Campylobacter concisus TaxID=199 RepID=UPI001F2162D4|nr:beta-ketoacyl synthase N-terminal-like domain-containing protein [Campylobacter concisus]
MLIYVSKPAIISAAGSSSNENLSSLLSGKRFLSLSGEFHPENKFLVAKFDKALPEFAKNTKEHFKTRTNALLLNTLLELDDEIKRAIKKFGKSRVGVILGTTTSGIEENFWTFKEYIKTDIFDKSKFGIDRNCLANVTEFVSEFYGLEGPSFCVSTACTSGVKAIIEAQRLIKSDICDAVICGGVDSLNTLTINGFNSLSILSQKPSQPFSKNREGINIGEGAGLFLLSRDEISNVVVAGSASNCDAFHMTQPDFNAKMAISCIEEALKKACMDGVDYVNLHGTGTQANDKMEAKAVNLTLGFAYASSLKPQIGHTLGAAGAIESAICAILCMQENSTLPPHVYDEEYDESLEAINLVKSGTKFDVKTAMSLSFAFGGDNAAIIFKRVR